MTQEVSAIADQLRAGFPESVRIRGRRYFDSDRVELVEVWDEGGRGTVRGSEAYRAFIECPDGEWRGFCSCPAFRQFGPCKHLWALILALDHAEGIELGPAEEGSEPPRREGLVPAAARVREAPRDDWRRRLERVLPWVGESAHDPWQGLAPPGLELVYLLHADGRHEAREPCVAVIRRKQGRSGRWGRWRPYHAGRSNEPDPPDPADQRLLETLTSTSSPQVDPWYWKRRDHSFPLPTAVADVLLPELCRTGRLYPAQPAALDEVERPGGDWAPGPSGEALTYDGGEPWTLTLRLVRDEKEKVSRLQSSLERGGTSRPFDDVDLVLTERHLLAGNEVIRFEGSPGWALALRQGDPITVPLEEEARLINTLRRLASPPIECPADLAPQQVRPIPHLWVEREEHAPNRRPLLRSRISFDYDGVRVRMSDPGSAVRVPGGERFLARDREAEREALRTFLQHGVRLDHGTGDADAGVAARDLPGAVAALLDAGWIVEAEGVPYRRAGSSRLSVTSGVDWFDLEGGLSFGDEVVDLPALLKAAGTGTRVVRLGDGSLGVLPEKWLEGWGLAGALAEVREDRLRFRPSQAWMLDALLAKRSGVAVDRRFARLQKRIAGFQGVQPAQEGRAFRGTLRPYQRDGLTWLRFLRDVGLGGCLADDMGLGKTVQVLALLDGHRGRARAAGHKPSLVVAPRSVVHNWIEEAGRFTPKLRVLEYTGPARRNVLPQLAEHDLVVTTYGVLRRDAVALKGERFGWAILDEAQAIKNERSQAAKAARLLRADHRLALSGTPVENHLGELWSLFEFLNPGMLGRSRTFRDLVRRKGLDPVDRADLAAAIRPFVLRRTKEQVLKDLPEKTEQTIHCELEGRQRRDYDEIRDHFRQSLLAEAEDGIPRMQILVLEALLRLRQAACHPGLIDASRTGEPSAKLEALLPLLDEVRESGHKALVFSQFTKLLAIVRARLDEQGVTYEYLDGRTRNRQRKVERFQTDEACPLFLISLKAGGLGLNLTAADYVFLLDPWWNPAVEAQAVDRAHRIGQRRPVTAYRLICRGTVEEKVLELQGRKRELADAILASDGSFLQDLTREDLEKLLS